MNTKAERWTPKPVTALSSEGVQATWVWDGYLAKGAVTLLVGLWKAGKTTLLSWLAKALSSDAGEFAGRAAKAKRILFVTEESEALWCRRRDELGLGERVEIISRPFLGRHTMETWIEFLMHVATLVLARGFDLVVFDTLPNLSPVEDENDNARTITALAPMHAIGEAGAAILLSGHPRKGDGTEGQAMRGAGATPAFVDIIVELRRYDAERRADSRRTLAAYSRYDETPDELVLDYDPDAGYRSVGTKADTSASDRLKVVRRILSGSSTGMTPEAIRGEWPDGSVAKPGLRTIKLDLERALGEMPPWLARTGAGVRGNAHHYQLSDSIPASCDPSRETPQASSAEPDEPSAISFLVEPPILTLDAA